MGLGHTLPHVTLAPAATPQSQLGLGLFGQLAAAPSQRVSPFQKLRLGRCYEFCHSEEKDHCWWQPHVGVGRAWLTTQLTDPAEDPAPAYIPGAPGEGRREVGELFPVTTSSAPKTDVVGKSVCFLRCPIYNH